MSLLFPPWALGLLLSLGSLGLRAQGGADGVEGALAHRLVCPAPLRLAFALEAESPLPADRSNGIPSLNPDAALNPMERSRPDPGMLDELRPVSGLRRAWLQARAHGMAMILRGRQGCYECLLRNPTTAGCCGAQWLGWATVRCLKHLEDCCSPWESRQAARVFAYAPGPREETPAPSPLRAVMQEDLDDGRTRVEPVNHAGMRADWCASCRCPSPPFPTSATAPSEAPQECEDAPPLGGTAE